MSAVTLEYDPVRGGFCLKFGSFRRYGLMNLCNGALLSFCIDVFTDGSDRIATIASYWGRGGLPLLGMYKTKTFPQGEFRVAGPELRVGPLEFRQNPKRLEFWFGTDDPLLNQSSRREDTGAGLVIWFSLPKANAGPVPAREERGLVAGLVVEFHRTVVTYPVSSLRITPSDFKG